MTGSALDHQAARVAGAPAVRNAPVRGARAPTEATRVATVKALQRSIGNRATERLLRPSRPQRGEAPARPHAREAAFIRATRHLLDATAVQPPAPGGRVAPADPAGSQPRAVQRVISKAQFIKDTTGELSWWDRNWHKKEVADRIGPKETLDAVEARLDAFEDAVAAEDIVAQVIALGELTGLTRSIWKEPPALVAAARKITDEGSELALALRASEEWIAHEEAAKRAAAEAAAAAEAERLEALGAMDWDDRVAAFKEQHGAGAVFETLIADTEDLAGKPQLVKLAQNFKLIGFTYSMKSVAGPALLGGRTEGDCSTVSNAMATIVREVFLGEATVEHCDDLLVEGVETTIDPDRAPTGADGAFWIFSNHYWVETPSGNFDPLFGREKSEDGWHLLAGSRDDPELDTEVDDFGGDWTIVSLIVGGGLRHAVASEITEAQWGAHVAATKATASYQRMRELTGVA